MNSREAGAATLFQGSVRCEERSGYNDGSSCSGEWVRMRECSDYREIAGVAARKIKTSSALTRAALVRHVQWHANAPVHVHEIHTPTYENKPNGDGNRNNNRPYNGNNNNKSGENGAQRSFIGVMAIIITTNIGQRHQSSDVNKIATDSGNNSANVLVCCGDYVQRLSSICPMVGDGAPFSTIGDVQIHYHQKRSFVKDVSIDPKPRELDGCGNW